MQQRLGRTVLALWVVTIAALIWVALEVRWTRKAMPEGLTYEAQQTLRSMADDIAKLAQQRR